MIDGPPLPPPTVVAPAPREVSFGRVQGTVPPGTRRLVVRVDGRVAADLPVRRRSFFLNVTMVGAAPVSVTAVDGSGRRATTRIDGAVGLPRAARPRIRSPSLDRELARTLTDLVRRHRGTTGIYVEDLRTGRGAAWNARARFPAASTLKVAVAVAVLRRLEEKPDEGSSVARLLAKMLVHSDNKAANDLEIWLGGSTSAGSARVNETMRALGLHDSEMYGGYEVRRPASAAPIPIRVESQPSIGLGKYTTAWDLARLSRAVYLAAAGKGPLSRLGVSSSEARHLLWLLAQPTDRHKLGRFVGPAAVVMHKSGWLPTAQHDSGVVAFRSGVYAATVMTWRTAAADELAGRVSLAALRRFG